MTEMDFLIVLDATSPKVEMLAELLSSDSRPVPGLSAWLTDDCSLAASYMVVLLCSHTIGVSFCVQISPSYQDTSDIRSGLI